jgi:hypothetical protein
MAACHMAPCHVCSARYELRKKKNLSIAHAVVTGVWLAEDDNKWNVLLGYK